MAKKIQIVVTDAMAKVREQQAPAYFINPEYAHANGDDVVICAPISMEKDLLDRGYKPSTLEAFETQGKDKTEPPAATPEPKK
jgi:hypothetical protein